MLDNKKILAVAILGTVAYLSLRSQTAGATALPTTQNDGAAWQWPNIGDLLPSWYPADDTPTPGAQSSVDPWQAWLNEPMGTDETPDDTAGTDETPGDDWTTPASGPDLTQGARNLAAFLRVIRVIESGGDNYDMIVGGQRLTSFAEHPWVLQPNRPYPAGYNSNASGAYQFLSTTWKIARDAAGVRDFSPASQDAAAVAILKFPWRNGAYADVVAGRFNSAMAKLVLEWEAFQKILAGSYSYSVADVQNLYQNAGGAVTA